MAPINLVQNKKQKNKCNKLLFILILIIKIYIYIHALKLRGFHFFHCLLPPAAEVSAFKPSSFYITITLKLGIHVMVQLSPVMQVFISADTSLKGNISGMTGH